MNEADKKRLDEIEVIWRRGAKDGIEDEVLESGVRWMIDSLRALTAPIPEDVKRVVEAAKQADWLQVVYNQGPPCFHFEPDRERFCLRAERWDGHRDPRFHEFASLADLLSSTLRWVEALERENALLKTRVEKVEKIMAKWSDPEFWKDDGCRMDSGDCAKELEEALRELEEK